MAIGNGAPRPHVERAAAAATQPRNDVSTAPNPDDVRRIGQQQRTIDPVPSLLAPPRPPPFPLVHAAPPPPPTPPGTHLAVVRRPAAGDGSAAAPPPATTERPTGSQDGGRRQTREAWKQRWQEKAVVESEQHGLGRFRVSVDYCLRGKDITL